MIFSGRVRAVLKLRLPADAPAGFTFSKSFPVSTIICIEARLSSETTPLLSAAKLS